MMVILSHQMSLLRAGTGVIKQYKTQNSTSPKCQQRYPMIHSDTNEKVL